MCESAGTISFWIWGLTALALLAWVIFVFAYQDTPAWYDRLDRWLEKRSPINGGLGDPIEAGFVLALFIAFITFIAWSTAIAFC